ncbi:hypothetical protein Tco_0155058, partial [Tanacetum coccineum]
MSELKTVDHSSEALAVLQSQVPTAFDTLIENENAMDKGVADIVKDHKRKHDDDEDPPAGPNQGKKTKRRRTKVPETPDPEWNTRQVVLEQPAQPWFNQMVSALKDSLT